MRGIIADPYVLDEDYVPSELPCREVQKKELVFAISPVGCKQPLDCICYGKPGTGKTALVKYVLRELNENTTTMGLYVNCWEKKTINQILDELLRQVQLPVVESSNSAKLAGLKQRLRGKPCVVALDEVDKLSRGELNDILYYLKGFGEAWGDLHIKLSEIRFRARSKG